MIPLDQVCDHCYYTGRLFGGGKETGEMFCNISYVLGL